MKQVEVDRIVPTSNKRLVALLLELAHIIDRNAHMHFFTVEGTRVCEHEILNQKRAAKRIGIFLVSEDDPT